MRRVAGPILFVLLCVAILATGLGIGAHNANWIEEKISEGKTTNQTPKTAERQEPWLTKDASGFFTFLLVFVGAFQLGLFVWQLWLIRESLIDAKTAADAAKEAADATNRQVAETRRLGEAQIRAYVDIISTQIAFADLLSTTLNLRHQSHPLVSVRAANTGQSPAKNFVWNPTVQYIVDGHSRHRGLGSNWRDIIGINIPAVGGTHSDRAMIANMELGQFLKQNDPEGKAVTILVRLRIQYEFEDVFDNRILGEAYFAGVFGGMPGQPWNWTGTLSRLHRPNDWPD